MLTALSCPKTKFTARACSVQACSQGSSASLLTMFQRCNPPSFLPKGKFSTFNHFMTLLISHLLPPESLPLSQLINPFLSWHCLELKFSHRKQAVIFCKDKLTTFMVYRNKLYLASCVSDTLNRHLLLKLFRDLLNMTFKQLNLTVSNIHPRTIFFSKLLNFSSVPNLSVPTNQLQIQINYRLL